MGENCADVEDATDKVYTVSKLVFTTCVYCTLCTLGYKIAGMRSALYCTV